MHVRFVFTRSASGRMLAGEAGQPVESATKSAGHAFWSPDLLMSSRS